MASVRPAKLSFLKSVPTCGENENIPPVVLIHGIAQTKERWKDSMQTLADDSKRVIYAVDLRNHGESEQFELFDFQTLTMDLEYFLDTHNINKVAVVGHSIGAIVAMNLALTQNDKVERIVLEDMSPVKFVPDLCVILAEMLREQHECLKMLPPNSEEDFVHRTLKECVYRTIPMISDEDREILEKMRFPIHKTNSGFEYCGNLPALWKSLQEPDMLIQNIDYSGQFDGGALFIYGGCSTVRVSDDEDIILRTFPKAKFKCVPDAGHEVYKYNPQEFVDKLIDFLK